MARNSSGSEGTAIITELGRRFAPACTACVPSNTISLKFSMGVSYLCSPSRSIRSVENVLRQPSIGRKRDASPARKFMAKRASI